MTRRNKLEKFVELLSFPNVYESPDFHNPSLIGLHGEPVELKGKWNSQHFKNNNPIVLELACGRGEYTLALAQMFPEKNFIGLDIKGARIHQGAEIALERQIENAAFLRTKIELIEHFFSEAEIHEIWITFPDPFLKESKSNKRLTSPLFLDKYRKILDKDSIIHLKTDDQKLYDYTLEIINMDAKAKLLYHDQDIYNSALPIEELGINTYYEIKHLGENKTIKYIKFSC
ncbi:MAG TPA: tRNA (guanosine(46)-N7)-methyltransferase TrmB [Saprospiraceae bacterium]|nr:tRNA (guanosine(46)-N7)-methyltransferase TrmB [Saprospiraceae bacterium]